jgi:hypothetical protein
MRPPAIERMGYYPTDDPVVEIIRTYLKPPVEKGRLFDPCAGQVHYEKESFMGTLLIYSLFKAATRSSPCKATRPLAD